MKIYDALTWYEILVTKEPIKTLMFLLDICNAQHTYKPNKTRQTLIETRVYTRPCVTTKTTRYDIFFNFVKTICIDFSLFALLFSIHVKLYILDGTHAVTYELKIHRLARTLKVC